MPSVSLDYRDLRSGCNAVRSDASARRSQCCISSRINSFLFFRLVSSCASFAFNSFTAAGWAAVLPPPPLPPVDHLGPMHFVMQGPRRLHQSTRRRGELIRCWCTVTANAPYNYGESQSQHGAYKLAWFAPTPRIGGRIDRFPEILQCRWGLESYLNNG